MHQYIDVWILLNLGLIIQDHGQYVMRILNCFVFDAQLIYVIKFGFSEGLMAD